MSSMLFLFFLSFNPAWGENILAQQLLSLLSPSPALGEPWPSIPGPNTRDRVCIVGAGAAGIHMAVSLEKRGYDKVIIFESSSRVGGKCYDINYRGTPQAQGANFLEANYFNPDSLVPFLREYDLADLQPVSQTNIWNTNSARDKGSNLTRAQYLLLAASKITNSSSDEVNSRFFLKAVIRYIQIHKEMFGLYEGDLMQRPTSQVLHRVRGTILDFLERENLLALVPVFQTTGTLAGYGHLDEIGALYSLMWHNPRLMLSMAMKALDQNREPFDLFSLKNGYEYIWRTIASKEKLNIQFKTDILSIQHIRNSVYLKTWQNFEPKTEVCDFLIWTPEASQYVRIVENPTREEKHLLATLKPEVYYVHLIDVEGGVRHSPTTAFMANVLQKDEEYAVTWTADTAGLLTSGIVTTEGIAKYNNGQGMRTLYAIHAPSKHFTNETFLKEKMRNFLMEGYNATRVEFLNTVAWTYFPRWSPEEVAEGRHWDVFRMQGKNNIWYAGVSASFESVRSVISYNNRLLKQMVPRHLINDTPSPYGSTNHVYNALGFNFQEKHGMASSFSDGKCKYRCTADGGCKVEYRGYSLGSCWADGACTGTPRECKDCNTVIKC